LAQLAKRYDAQALKRFAPAKRYALVACFLAETRKTLLDHVVEMHDQGRVLFGGALASPAGFADSSAGRRRGIA
jgi:hypothetical protein